ncbi:MAG: DMT family transporter [Solirubrobacterales bacterium]|nr:DMT family transporter [Solirubrobacterales bacterium]
MLATVMSLVAAVLYAAASVFQHRAAVAAPRRHSLRPGLLGHLATQPWWLAGIVADGGGFGAQFIALAHGPLVLVQPLLVSGLLFALPLSALISGSRIRRNEVTASALVVGGLGVLLVSANPGRGHSAIHMSAWAWLLAATLVPTAAFVVASLGRPALKPALLATSGGILYGLTAALTKATAHALKIGVVHVLGSWQLYALVAAGAIGMVITQSAFQAGPLRASLPLLTVVDPMVSIAIGISVFHEHMDQDPLRIALELVGAAAMTVGVFMLGRSPLIAPEDQAPVIGERSAHGVDRL